LDSMSIFRIYNYSIEVIVVKVVKPILNVNRLLKLTNAIEDKAFIVTTALGA